MSSHKFIERISVWQRRIRSRNELARLGADQLRDLPFSRADLKYEANKWFWQP